MRADLTSDDSVEKALGTERRGQRLGSAAGQVIQHDLSTLLKIKMLRNFKDFHGDSIVNMIGDIIFTLLGVWLAYSSPKYAVIYVISSEILLHHFGASLLHLSFGSLIN